MLPQPLPDSQFDRNRNPTPDRPHQRGFLLGVMAPLACIAINIPSLCGPRAFELNGAAEVLRPLFLAFGALGCITMTWSVFTDHPSPRLAGRLAGALSVAAGASAIALFLLLPNLIGLVLFPPALLLGFPPFISVALWARCSFALLTTAAHEQTGQTRRRFVEGAAIAIGIALATQAFALALVHQATETLIQGDIAYAPHATSTLQAAFWCGDSCSRSLREAFTATQDPSRQQVLRDAYRTLEGKEIDGYDGPHGCY